MQKWIYSMFYADLRQSGWCEPSRIWEHKGKSGETAFNRLEKFAEDGWELVAVTPLSDGDANGGRTAFVLYTLKKLSEE